MLQKYESGQLIPASEEEMSNLITYQTFVKWYKPQKRTIIANGCRHHLAFPYMVFIRIRGRLKVVLTLEPPVLDSPTYACPLSNIFVGSSDVCLDEMEEEKTFENMIDYFWNSEFGSGYLSRYLPYSKWHDIEMDDVLNPEHWIRQSEYHERFQRENFLGSWLESQYFSMRDANTFESMNKLKTLKDILTYDI